HQFHDFHRRRPAGFRGTRIPGSPQRLFRSPLQSRRGSAMNIARLSTLWVAWTSVLACPCFAASTDPLDRALAFLASQQNTAASSSTPAAPKPAITALCLMSFLSTGHTPDTGKYGPVVRHAADYLLKSIPDDGYVGRADGSRMYGQGIVTLALAEVYGVEIS